MRTTRYWLLSLALIGSALALLTATASAQDAPGEAAPAEAASPSPGGDYGYLSGQWNSEHGPVTLVVDSSGKVTGTFEGGGALTGTIKEETIRGKDADNRPTETKVTQLKYTWTQTDSKGGAGFFSLAGERLVGSWGYGKSTSNGGDWSLYR